MRLWWSFVGLFLCSLYTLVVAGGDGDPAYKKCIHERFYLCYKQPNISFYEFEPFSFVSWGCMDRAKYRCMKGITDGRAANNEPVEKYYGHWVFHRYFGLEEPGSVLFSVMNLIPHGLYVIRYTFAKETLVRDPWMLVYALVSILLWTASSNFHIHKTNTSTSYDYATGFASISYGLVLAIRRVFSASFPRSVAFISTLSLLLICMRVAYMLQNNVDFQDHFQLCVGLIVATCLVWLSWVGHCAVHSYWYKVADVNMSIPWKCFFCQLSLGVASLLEVLDFPPFFGAFDAHSLWHAATVPIFFFWYHMWIDDCLERRGKNMKLM